jgi:hypothetical protein
MATEAQVSAYRHNAAKSTGPRTAEGKAVVAEEGGYSPSCEIAKQSQSPAVEGGHRPQCETANQSQSEGVSSSKCEGSSGVGSAAEDNLSRQTKPIHAAGTVCSVPARASRSTRILPMTLNRGRDAHATATPCGVTTSGPDSAKQSQFAAQEGGHKPPCEIAKQSQSPGVKGGHRPQCEAAEQSQSEEAASVTCEVYQGGRISPGGRAAAQNKANGGCRTWVCQTKPISGVCGRGQGPATCCATCGVALSQRATLALSA